MKKNDLLLILLLLVVFSAAIAAVTLFGRTGETVVVSVNGNETGSYALSEDTRVPIGTTNVLVIEGKKAYMESADCPDQICVRHKPITKCGEEIICLPNRVIVRIR